MGPDSHEGFLNKNFSKASVIIIFISLIVFLITEFYILKKVNYYRSVLHTYETKDYLVNLRNILKEGHTKQKQQ